MGDRFLAFFFAHPQGQAFVSPLQIFGLSLAAQVFCSCAHSESVQFSLKRTMNAPFERSEVKAGIELALDPKFEYWEIFLRQVVRSVLSKPVD